MQGYYDPSSSAAYYPSSGGAELHQQPQPHQQQPQQQQQRYDFGPYDPRRSPSRHHRFLETGANRNIASSTMSGEHASYGGGNDQMSYYNQCVVEVWSNTTGLTDARLMECISDKLQAAQARQRANANDWLLVLAGALVFFMQVGFAMLCAGCVRRKNVQNTMLKNLLDACGAAIAFYCVGFAFAFGGQDAVVGNTFIGYSNFFLMGDVNPAFFFFEYAFSATSVTIVAGTLAERCQMAAYLCYSLFLTGFVYPVVAHSIWSNNGFLSAFSNAPVIGNGVIDFAGSGVVHLTGGTTALIATHILGARRGRFTDNRGRPLDKPKNFPGHSIALQLMGTMVLWFGWYGFNPGSALLLTNATSTGYVAALAAANTSLAAASAAISALFTNLYLQERKTGEYNFDLTMAMNGCLAGLVAVTAPCGTIEYWAAIVVGLVAGWIYIGGSRLLIHLRLDDAVDAIPVHMFNGAWGLVATGLLSSPDRVLAAFGSDQHVGWFYSLGRGSFDATLLANQIVALLFIVGWAFATMGPFFMWLNYMGWFRSDSLEELVGLDISYHGGQHGDDDEVNADHVKAYNRHKNNVRRRRGGGSSSPDGNDTTPVTDDMSYADDASWMDMSMASNGNGGA